MSIELCVLASGSGGNCTAVRTPGGVVLVDAGLGPRTTAQRMRGTGVCVADVFAICLTHLDHDHFNRNWLATVLRRGIRVYCHASRVNDAVRTVLNPSSPRDQIDRFRSLVEPFDDQPFEPAAGLEFRPVRFNHDRMGSHGFVMSGFGCRVGFATDLGRVPETLYEDFDALDVLALESNYDRQMQLDSPRPWFLKNRIMGGWGHLSNEQAFDAVRKLLNRYQARGWRLPAHIVLLHRSAQCNCPDVMRRLFSRDARVAPRLVLAEQHERSPWLCAGARREESGVGDQLQLAWG